MAGSEARRSAAAMPQVVSVQNDVEMDAGGDKPGAALTTTQKIKATAISLVNPSFTNYTRSFLLASVVLALTAVGTGVVLFFQMHSQNTVCSSIVQYPQVVGTYTQQRDYVDYLEKGRNESVQDARAQTGNVRSETTIEVCIQSAHMQGAADATHVMSFNSNKADNDDDDPTQFLNSPGPVLPCIPPRGFRDGQEVLGYGPPRDLDLQKFGAPEWSQKNEPAKKTPLCDSFSVGKVCANYWKSQGKSKFVDTSACAATTEQDFMQRQPLLYDLLQCPAIDSVSHTLPWIILYRYEVITCTTTTKKLVDAIGTAMAYSSYIETAVTALCVVVLTNMGIIVMKRAVSTAVLLELVDDDPQEELDRITAELKVLKEQVAKLRQANVAQAQPTPQQEQQQGACCAGCGAPKKAGKSFCKHCGQKYADAAN